jgi:hypothetical protein
MGSFHRARVGVEAARATLEGAHEGLPVVADRSGFGSTETMRRAFSASSAAPRAHTGQFRNTGITSEGADAQWPGTIHRVPVSTPQA